MFVTVCPQRLQIPKFPLFGSKRILYQAFTKSSPNLLMVQKWEQIVWTRVQKCEFLHINSQFIANLSFDFTLILEKKNHPKTSGGFRTIHPHRHPMRYSTRGDLKWCYCSLQLWTALGSVWSHLGKNGPKSKGKKRPPPLGTKPSQCLFPTRK